MKLYEQDPYLTTFSAAVQSCTQSKKGYDIVLDQTAFYPEGGGQPCDLGILGGTEVLDVQERGGQIIHTCKDPLEPGSTVTGTIDWARRFDLMQQHSGEHIVSGFAHSRWGCDNVGFHMGSELITIDLNTLLTEQDLAELEDQVNAYVWEDHPVQVRYPSKEELEQIPYRSKKAIDGQVRLITFPGADTCACCGTHISSSGQVGLVKLLSVQKFRDGVRIELVCGSRALRYLNTTLAQNRIVSNLLSAKPFQTGAAVERLLVETNQLKSHMLTMEQAHFAAVAEQYAGAGDVVVFEDGLSPDSLRRLCDAVLDVCGGRCACFSGEEGGFKYAIGHRGGDLRVFTKALNQTLSGRGGGKPEFVQGRVQAEQASIEAFLAEH